MNAIAQTLDAARSRIENGWHQGCYFKPTREDAVSVCAMGAVELAAPDSGPEYWGAMQCLGEALGVPPYSSPIIAWNDTPGRTQEEVVEAFTVAAAKARGEA